MSELDRWEAKFAGDGYLFGTEPNAFLSRQAALLKPGMTALSVADGEGRNGVWLARKGLRVTSQDFSPSAQAKARALAERHGVAMTFELSDITTRNWEPDLYDVIVGIFFQFLPSMDRARVFEGMRQSVKPGGLVLIEGYGLGQPAYGTGGPSSPDKLYSERLLRQAFAGFSQVDVRCHDAELAEGTRARRNVVARRFGGAEIKTSAHCRRVGSQKAPLYPSGASITTVVSCGTTL